MQDVNVVVVFCSSGESTERLALAAAVGAVQGRANIRLRRLPDIADEAALAHRPKGPLCASIREDMEYVAPRDADAEWADAILVGMPLGSDTIPGEFERFLGKLKGKIGASFMLGSESAALHAAIERAGLIAVGMIPDPDALTAARLRGRRVADMVRSLRS